MIFLSFKNEFIFSYYVIDSLTWKLECQEKVIRSIMNHVIIFLFNFLDF